MLHAARARRSPLPPLPLAPLALLLAALVLCAQVSPSAAKTTAKRRGKGRGLREASDKPDAAPASDGEPTTPAGEASSSASQRSPAGEAGAGAADAEASSGGSAAATSAEHPSDKPASAETAASAEASSSTRPAAASTSTAASAAASSSPATAIATASAEASSSESASHDQSGEAKVLGHGYNFDVSDANGLGHGGHASSHGQDLPLDLKHNPGKQFSLQKRPPGLTFPPPSTVHGNQGRSAGQTFSDCPLDTGKTKLAFACSPSGPTLPPNPYFYEKPILLKGPRHTFLSYKNKFHIPDYEESISNANAFNAYGNEPEFLDYGPVGPSASLDYANSDYDPPLLPTESVPHFENPYYQASIHVTPRESAPVVPMSPSIANANALTPSVKSPQPSALCGKGTAQSATENDSNDVDIVNANVVVAEEESEEESAEEKPTSPPIFLYLPPPGNNANDEDDDSSSDENDSSYAAANVNVIGEGMANANALSGGISNANVLGNGYVGFEGEYGSVANANSFDREFMENFAAGYADAISNSNALGSPVGIPNNEEETISNVNVLPPEFGYEETFGEAPSPAVMGHTYDDYGESISNVNAVAPLPENTYDDFDDGSISNSNSLDKTPALEINEDYDYIYDVPGSISNANTFHPNEGNGNAHEMNIANANAVTGHHGGSIANANAVDQFQPNIANANAMGGENDYGPSVSNANSVGGPIEYGDYAEGISNSNSVGKEYADYGPSIANANAVEHAPNFEVSNSNAVGNVGVGSISNANVAGGGTDYNDYEPAISNTNAVGRDYGDYGVSISNANALGGAPYEGSISNANAIGSEGGNIANANALGVPGGNTANANALQGGIANANAVDVSTNVQFGSPRQFFGRKKRSLQAPPPVLGVNNHTAGNGLNATVKGRPKKYSHIPKENFRRIEKTGYENLENMALKETSFKKKYTKSHHLRHDASLAKYIPSYTSQQRAAYKKKHSLGSILSTSPRALVAAKE